MHFWWKVDRRYIFFFKYRQNIDTYLRVSILLKIVFREFYKISISIVLRKFRYNVENIDIAIERCQYKYYKFWKSIDIAKKILKNIDIDKGILQNIDINRILYQ